MIFFLNIKGGTLIFFRPVLAPAKGGKPAYDKQKQYNIIELKKSVGIGYQLSLSFNGSFIEKIIGFYKSKYKDSDNNFR
jgi:hypothetical protein